MSAPAYEDTPEGAQAVLPGAERSPLRTVLERRMGEPIRKTARTMDGLPLFDQAPTVDLEDYLKALGEVVAIEAAGAAEVPAEEPYDPTDPLAIPPFLRRKRVAGRKSRAEVERTWWMPPKSLAAVNRAVRDGCDTMQQIKKRLRDRFDDSDIRASLRALTDSGEVRARGRRYEHTRGG